MLCSVCGDLRISEIVDMPNWVVSFYFPRLVLAVTGGAGAAIATIAAHRWTLEGLEVGFRTETGLSSVVEGVSLRLAEGRNLGLVGELGCGKSVTAQAIMRLLPEPPAMVRARRLDVAGRDLLRMSERAMRAIRGNTVAMIFQEPMTSLNPTWTVGYQIDESLRLHTELGAGDRRARALDLLRRVGVGGAERRLDQYPFELSGGLRQRVMIAMALACGPRLLIADEPTTALDVTIQAQILELLAELPRGVRDGDSADHARSRPWWPSCATRSP